MRKPQVPDPNWKKDEQLRIAKTAFPSNPGHASRERIFTKTAISARNIFDSLVDTLGISIRPIMKHLRNVGYYLITAYEKAESTLPSTRQVDERFWSVGQDTEGTKFLMKFGDALDKLYSSGWPELEFFDSSTDCR